MGLKCNQFRPIDSMLAPIGARNLLHGLHQPQQPQGLGPAGFPWLQLLAHALSSSTGIAKAGTLSTPMPPAGSGELALKKSADVTCFTKSPADLV
jgi:hypothetical protein